MHSLSNCFTRVNPGPSLDGNTVGDPAGQQIDVRYIQGLVPLQYVSFNSSQFILKTLSDIFNLLLYKPFMSEVSKELLQDDKNTSEHAL